MKKSTITPAERSKAITWRELYDLAVKKGMQPNKATYWANLIFNYRKNKNAN